MLLRVFNAPEAERAGAIVSRSHQQELAVLFVAICLRKVPDGSLRLVVAPSADNRCARVLIHIFIRPLPHVPHHIHYAERAGPLRVRIDGTCDRHYASFVRRGRRRICGITLPRACKRTGACGRREPVAIPPWKDTVIVSLRCKLPLPLMRKPLACP